MYSDADICEANNGVSDDKDGDMDDGKSTNIIEVAISIDAVDVVIDGDTSDVASKFTDDVWMVDVAEKPTQLYT